MNWTKTGRTVSQEGTTVTYTAKEDEAITIESRKRHIPHANGVGTWDHTTYVVRVNGEDVKKFYSLKDAKEYADLMQVGE